MSGKRVQEQIELFADVLRLTQGEAKVYLALLSKEGLKASEVAQLTSLSRPTVYEILLKLEQLGFCYQSGSGTKVFKAVSPTSATSQLLTAKELQLKNARALVDELETLYATSKDNESETDVIEVIRYTTVLRGRHYKLIEEASSEILGFMKGPYISSQQWENAREVAALKRGVTVKVIYETHPTMDKQIIENIKSIAQKGEESRVNSNLPMTMLIFDRKTVVGNLRDEKTGGHTPTAFIIEHSEYAEAMRRTFETWWNESVPFNEFLESPEGRAISV